MSKCYYGNPEVCKGRLWQCKTCKEKFCQFHYHQTTKGRNVECVACASTREENEKAAAEKEDVE